MIVVIPMNGYVANKMNTFQIRQMKNKDDRIKLMNEILNGIKVLKLYGWELSFAKEVAKVRGKEVQTLKNFAILRACSAFLWSFTPYLV